MALSRRNKENRNITEMNHEKVKGYWVRVVKDGKLHQKLFPYSRFSGKRNALEAARMYRNELREKLFGEHGDAERRVCTSFKSNTSGVVGVHYVVKHRGSSVHRAWVASWCPVKGGPQKHKYFSISKLGDAEAKHQAIEFRKARVDEILREKR